MERKLLCQRHPALYALSVWTKRVHRSLTWVSDGRAYAHHKSPDQLPYRVKKHQSVLIRKLGDSDQYLQYNKVQNLKLAVKQINGVVIRPGETFSFCRLVGRPTRKRGFIEGMELSRGEARPGVGGGICQIANLLHWLVLHSPLTVVERHHHSFDPFPDDNRVLPFGSGATVFYNYRDYQFENKTDFTFQVNLWLSEKCLEGELRADRQLPYAFHVFEREHVFLRIGDRYYRKNEIWRKKYLKFKGGEEVEEELVTRNFAEVKYVPAHYQVVQTDLKLIIHHHPNMS